jgi:hypothetical protein
MSQAKFFLDFELQLKIEMELIKIIKNEIWIKSNLFMNLS